MGGRLWWCASVILLSKKLKSQISRKAKYQCQQQHSGNLTFLFPSALNIDQGVSLLLFFLQSSHRGKLCIQIPDQRVTVQIDLPGIGSDVPFQKQLGVDLAVVAGFNGLND